MKLEDVKEFFDTQPLMYLATTEEDQPRVRPMALIYHDDQCWCCSIGGRPKIKQIQENNKIEFAVNAQSREDMATVRGLGRANIIENRVIKKQLSEAIPWFSGYWESYDDPNFVLFHLDIEEIEVQVPAERTFHFFNLKDGTVSSIKK